MVDYDNQISHRRKLAHDEVRGLERRGCESMGCQRKTGRKVRGDVARVWALRGKQIKKGMMYKRKDLMVG